MKTLIRSPWGKVQRQYQITLWLASVSTASHGGLKVDAKYNRFIPLYLRKKSGWYEEDCEWAIVFVVLCDLIAHDFCAWHMNKDDLAQNIACAHESFARWYPDFYKIFTCAKPPFKGAV